MKSDSEQDPSIQQGNQVIQLGVLVHEILHVNPRPHSKRHVVLHHFGPSWHASILQSSDTTMGFIKPYEAFIVAFHCLAC